MRKTTLLAVAMATVLGLASTEALATNYTLWIHGRSPSFTTAKGNYNSWAYWGSSATVAGVNKKSVNWGGEDATALTTNNTYVIRALDCFCTGANWCYIAAHSAGDLQIGYSLANSGSSTRYKKNATPDATGTCGNLTGSPTQVGWNIKWIESAGGAGGGSELANLASAVWADTPLTRQMTTTAARALYNHNTTSVMFNMLAGAKGTLYSGTLPGQDDEVIAYHSSGGVSVVGSFCNPGDSFCDGTLNTGTSGTSNGKTLWTNHNVIFRDTTEAYNHYTNGAWGGIVSVMLTSIVTYAI